VKKLFKQRNFIAASLLTLIGILSTGTGGADAIIVIDPFNDGLDPIFYPPFPTPIDINETAATNGGGVLGGEREVRVIPSPVGTLAGIPTNTYNIQTFAPAIDVTSIVRLRWDGTTNNPGGAPGSFSPVADFSSELALRIFVVNQNDLKAGSLLSYTLYDGTTSRTASIVLPVGDVAASTLYTLDFSLFAGINLSNITGVELTVNLVGGDNQPYSIQLDQFEIGVPFEFSPAIGLFSLGALFGLSHLRNRRKSSVSPNLEASKSEEDSLVS